MYALLVDNNLITAAGLKGIVERFEGESEIVNCLTAPSLLSVAERLKPDVIIYDFSLIGNDIEYYTQTIREQNSKAYILAIVKTDDFDTLYRAIEENLIDDYIFKPISHSDLLARLRIAEKNRGTIKKEVNQLVEQLDYKQHEEDFFVKPVVSEDIDLEAEFESVDEPGFVEPGDVEPDVVEFGNLEPNDVEPEEGKEKFESVVEPEEIKDNEDDWEKLFDQAPLDSSQKDEAVDTEPLPTLFDDDSDKEPEADSPESKEGEAESLSDWFDLGDLNGDAVEDRDTLKEEITPASALDEAEPFVEPVISAPDEPARIEEDLSFPEELEGTLVPDQGRGLPIFEEPDLPAEDQLFADQQASSGPVLFEEPEAESEEPHYSPVVSPTPHAVDPQGFEDLFGPRSKQVDSFQDKQTEPSFTPTPGRHPEPMVEPPTIEHPVPDLELPMERQPEVDLEPTWDEQPDSDFDPTWDKQPEPEAEQPQFDFSVDEVLSADPAAKELPTTPFMDEPDLTLNHGVVEDNNYGVIQQQYDYPPPVKKTGAQLFNIQDPQNEIGEYFPGIGFDNQGSENTFIEEPVIPDEPELVARQDQEKLPGRSRATKRKASGGSISRFLNIFGNILFGLLLLMMVTLSFFLIQSRVTGDVPNVFGYQMYIVLSGSMSPEFDTGSLAFVRETDPAVLAVGDIITYRSAPGSDSLTTHRIVEVRNGSDLRFVTRGDANAVNDPSPVQAENVVGRVTGSVPYLGYVMDFAQTRQGLILLIFVPGVLIIILELGKILKYLTEKDNQEGSKEKEKITDRAESF